jgi:hypothetical protein
MTQESAGFAFSMLHSGLLEIRILKEIQLYSNVLKYNKKLLFEKKINFLLF